MSTDVEPVRDYPQDQVDDSVSLLRSKSDHSRSLLLAMSFFWLVGWSRRVSRALSSIQYV